MYQIRILDAATRELAKLDAATARRMVNRVRWLAENSDEIKPEAFTGNLAGFYKTSFTAPPVRTKSLTTTRS
jgi:mRNA-degrading endonuclease RelE of RelBE toxin-antitoxin system